MFLAVLKKQTHAMGRKRKISLSIASLSCPEAMQRKRRDNNVVMSNNTGGKN
jgi:hypothetical protein